MYQIQFYSYLQLAFASQAQWYVFFLLLNAVLGGVQLTETESQKVKRRRLTAAAWEWLSKL